MTSTITRRGPSRAAVTTSTTAAITAFENRTTLAKREQHARDRERRVGRPTVEHEHEGRDDERGRERLAVEVQAGVDEPRAVLPGAMSSDRGRR